MATFVIVHGAFGGGWEWREVASMLRARGHEVFTPSLTGFAERVHLATPETGLETHLQVILACQSYGGMVVTAVADRMPERLAHLVYLNALVPEAGQSVFDLLPPAIRQRFAEAAQSHGEGWRVPAPPFEDDPVIAAFARGRHVPSPLRMFTDPVHLGPAPALLRTYIWCTEDPARLAGVADLMQPFAAQAQRDPRWRFRQLTSPPDAFIHMPQVVVELFDEVARTGEVEANAFQEPADARPRKTPPSR
ncbi:MAG: alpha/beta fold hydrolase [Nocardioidaceae bacterium]|nr:alpha/beta fold hydrolase [Nocardioidaceae bacterium]